MLVNKELGVWAVFVCMEDGWETWCSGGKPGCVPEHCGDGQCTGVPAFLRSLLLWLGLQQPWATLFDGALAVVEGGSVLHGGRKEPG